MSSSSSATVRVEKATSDLLIGPDWTMNIDICDSINSQHWQAKDVVKAVKKRLQNKSPKVQHLALTLLETMIKNCGEPVHFQLADKHILQEMVKIVRKKTDMQVRDKALVLIDSWQEAFGGPGAKYPQYYWAYDELRRSGVEFPKRTRDAAPIFTPPVAHPMVRHSQPGYGMPSNTSVRLDEAMASEMDNLSLSNLDSMRSVMELLADMLHAVNPNDCEAVKDEVIVDLVSRCRANQKKLVQMLSSTGDEELLGQGIELNDNLQSLLAKHDAIASGSPLPNEVRDFTSRPAEARDSSSRPTETRDSSPRASEVRDPSLGSDAASSTTPLAIVTSSLLEEEEEEDDDFAQLARRRTKKTVIPCENSSNGISEGAASSSMGNELALPTPPSSVRTTSKEQDMIDLLSMTLSTTSTSPHTPPPPTSSQNMHQIPVSPTTQGYHYGSQPYPGNQGQQIPPFNNYVAPWAQPQTDFQSAPQPQPQPQAQFQQQVQPQFLQYSYNYPPPPWATGPTNSYQGHLPANNPSPFLSPRANTSGSYMPTNMARPLQSHNSFPTRTSDGSAVYGETQINSAAQRPSSPAAKQKPFVPSYRLFEDLNVLGNADGGFKANGTSNSLSGMSGQSMVGGRK